MSENNLEEKQLSLSKEEKLELQVISKEIENLNIKKNMQKMLWNSKVDTILRKNSLELSNLIAVDPISGILTYKSDNNKRKK